jgi:hypothetical protein
MDRNILFSRSESGFVNTLDDLGKSGQNRGKEEERHGGGEPQQVEDRVVLMAVAKSSCGTNVSNTEGGCP